jgi:hypothetical protein
MTTCAILIDTNLVLHYQPIDQVDWPSISGFDDCALVIAPILLRELEQQKIFNRSVALRERASRMIDFLVEKMALPDPITLRPHVTLQFIDHEPTIDFAANRLVREVQDDHYIASALDHHLANRIATFIASNDGGMALKLRARPITNIRLPEGLRLPPEVDAEQRELRDAKLQLARMQAQRPKLSLQFIDGSRRLAICNARSLTSKIKTLEQVQLELPPLPFPEAETDNFLDSGLPTLRGLRGSPGLGKRTAIERYNRELEEYYDAYKRYSVETSDWLEKLRLSAVVEVEILNDGSATATNIDVSLRFPSSVNVMRERDLPKKLRAPQPPVKPGTIRDWMGSSRDFSPLDSHYLDLHVHDGAVYIDDDERGLEFSFKSLKQKCVGKADKFLLTRDAMLTGRGIEVDVSITYHEGEPVDQKLAITFSEADSVEPHA